MYNLSKEEKLDFILKKQKELNISATLISKNTKLTEAGVQRILKGISKSPQESSLNAILEFFERKVSGSENNKVEENKPATYEKEPVNFDIEKNPLVICLNEKNNLTKEIMKLQGLLRKNKIDFKDIFNEE